MKFQKQFIRSIKGISRLIEIFNKSISKPLDDSIDSRLLFNGLKETSDQSKGILDQLKNWRNSSRSLWMTRSILDSYSIDWKEHSIDQKEFLVGRDSWNYIFQIFLVTIFYVSLEQNIVPWSYQNVIEIKTELHWCYSLKVQYGMVKIKLKQCHNINISFIKQ